MFILFILIKSIAPQLLHRVPELLFILFFFVLTVPIFLLYNIEPSLLYLLLSVIVLFMDSFSRPAFLCHFTFISCSLALITDSYQLFLINVIAGGVAVFVFKFWEADGNNSYLLSICGPSDLDISLHLISEFF